MKYRQRQTEVQHNHKFPGQYCSWRTARTFGNSKTEVNWLTDRPTKKQANKPYQPHQTKPTNKNKPNQPNQNKQTKPTNKTKETNETN